MRWAGHVALVGGKEEFIQYLVGNRGEKRPLGVPRHRWEDNIEMDLREG
jgi:hypothetical protein